jgi:hypothetical protein
LLQTGRLRRAASGGPPERPTLDTVWRVAVPLVLLARLQWMVIRPDDFWWHLRVGQILAETGSLPSVDLFTFTRAGAPWLNQSWLMEALLYRLFAVGGLPLVLFVHALAITAGYALLLRATRTWHGLHAGTLATGAGALVGSMNWAARPQDFSFLAFGALVWLIEAHRHGRTRTLAWAIPLFALWVNAHGGFVFGIGLLGCYVLGRSCEWLGRGRPIEDGGEIAALLAIGAGCLAALALNPAGPLGILRYVQGFLSSDMTLRMAEEFQPLSLRQPDGVLFFASWVVLGAALLRSGFRPRPDQWLALLVFSAAALLARRVAPWYGFALAPVLAAALEAPLARRFPARALGDPLRNAVYLAALVAGVAVTLPWLRPWVPGPGGTHALVAPDTPVAATAALCEQAGPEARVFQEMEFASYQIWACPRLPVFQDARNELYPPGQWLDYLHLRRGRYDWEEIARHYGITHLFLRAANSGGVEDAAARSSDWREIYRDETAVIYAQAGPSAP